MVIYKPQDYTKSITTQPIQKTTLISTEELLVLGLVNNHSSSQDLRLNLCWDVERIFATNIYYPYHTRSRLNIENENADPLQCRLCPSVSTHSQCPLLAIIGDSIFLLLFLLNRRTVFHLSRQGRTNPSPHPDQYSTGTLWNPYTKAGRPRLGGSPTLSAGGTLLGMRRAFLL